MARDTGRVALHNLGTVVAFEIRRTLKRRSFWLLTLAVPMMMVGLMALSLLSSATASRSSESASKASVPFTYTDASGLVDPAVAGAAGGKPAVDAAAARAEVIAGAADLFIAYPGHPESQPIEIVGRDKGLLDTNRDYSSIARSVLLDSVRQKVPDPRVASVLAESPATHTVTYDNGKVARGWASVILPGMFIVLFYMAILLLGNQMLNITVEEKENRVTEMILTTIHPTTLILGKILALLAVGVIQLLVAMIPLSLAPGLISRAAAGPSDATGSAGALPSGAELAASIDPGSIALGLTLFVGAFLMFTGLLVSIGAVMPTAKDAGQAFGAVVICLFLPLYVIGIIMSDPHGAVSQLMTFFPLTAPITAMARNATGTLWPWEAALSVLIIYACAVAFIALGVRLFRTGSISYDARLDVRKVFSNRTKVRAKS